MKVIVILLLLASVAWAGDTCLLQCKNKEISPNIINGTIECECVDLKKGHCPHCGAKYIRDAPIKYFDKDTKNIEYMLLFLCPNGHVFWEGGDAK